MKKIFLRRGKGFAMVDDDDYEHLSQFHWCLSGGYATRTWVEAGRCRQTSMHREIMECPEGLVVDHVDECKLNNQRHNLQIVTKGENTRFHYERERAA